jgi:hypothetical protein
MELRELTPSKLRDRVARITSANPVLLYPLKPALPDIPLNVTRAASVLLARMTRHPAMNTNRFIF